MKANRLRIFRTDFSAFSIRFEISISSFLVSRGIRPICLRYIRTGSSKPSSLLSSFWLLEPLPCSLSMMVAGARVSFSEELTIRNSMARRRSRRESITSGSTKPSGRSSLMSSWVRNSCPLARLINFLRIAWISGCVTSEIGSVPRVSPALSEPP